MEKRFLYVLDDCRCDSSVAVVSLPEGNTAPILSLLPSYMAIIEHQFALSMACHANPLNSKVLTIMLIQVLSSHHERWLSNFLRRWRQSSVPKRPRSTQRTHGLSCTVLSLLLCDRYETVIHLFSNTGR